MLQPLVDLNTGYIGIATCLAETYENSSSDLLGFKRQHSSGFRELQDASIVGSLPPAIGKLEKLVTL